MKNDFFANTVTASTTFVDSVTANDLLSETPHQIITSGLG